MKVFVVMGNDYPDAVFWHESAANRYVEDKKREDKVRQRDAGTIFSRIYWRVYDFELREDVP